MVRTSYLAALVTMLLSVATSAPAQVTLKFKFPDGGKSTSLTRIKSTQTLSLAGRDLDTESDQVLTVTTVNGRRAADGELKLKSKIDAIKVSSTFPGGAKLEFDSAKPDADPPGTQFDFVLDIFKAMANSSWTSVLDKDNRVTSIVDRDAAFADLPENLRNAMKAQLDPVYLKTAANAEFDKLPSKPVSPGDSWERILTSRLDSGQKLTFTTKYTYQGPITQDGKQLEKITAKTTAVDYSVDANAPLKVIKSDLKVADSEGVLLFDPALGQFASQQGKVHVTGSLKLEINNNELAGELDLTMENSVTLKSRGD